MSIELKVTFLLDFPRGDEMSNGLLDILVKDIIRVKVHEYQMLPLFKPKAFMPFGRLFFSKQIWTHYQEEKEKVNNFI